MENSGVDGDPPRPSEQPPTAIALPSTSAKPKFGRPPSMPAGLARPPARRLQPRLPGEAAARDLRLDFFRGLSLVFIFIDHIPGNILSWFTLQSVQFFDAAEVFIFISGYTAALVYGRAFAVQGRLYATAQILRRAWQLYVAHIFLFMIFIAEVSYTVMTFNNPMYNDEMRVGDFLGEPHIAVIKALLLQFQPTFLDILPLYIVLLAVFPIVLFGLQWRPLVVLIPSLAVYLVVQATGLLVPAYPPGDVWYFNPLAWQVLFVAGAAMGLGKVPAMSVWRGRRLAGVILAAAGTVLAIGFAVRLSWTIHGLWDPFPGFFLRQLWPVNKTNLSPIRLLPFAAAVVVAAAVVSPDARFLRSAAARPLVLCGRQSLEIFCLGILLSALGHFVISEYDATIPVQLVVNLIGILAMYLTARMIDWYKAMDRMRQPEIGSTASGRGGGAG